MSDALDLQGQVHALKKQLHTMAEENARTKKTSGELGLRKVPSPNTASSPLS